MRRNIKQVSELYDITIATLYYYERIGLFVPRRDPDNNYRYYEGEDFAHLNLIRTLRDMNVDLEEIKAYEASHTLSQNVSLLQNELVTIDEEMGRLRARQNAVQSALTRYARALIEAPKEEIFLVDLPDRPCIKVCDKLADPDDIPLVCAEKLRENNIGINVFQILPTFSLKPELNESGTFNAKSLLLYSELPIGCEDHLLPAGSYLTVTFRGSLKKTPDVFARLESYGDDHNLEKVGDPIEFWDINEYSSELESEFVHTLQQQVRQVS